MRDIKASADYLVQQGIADPERLGIMGGSYGGYMMMAGVTEYPDLFAAGVNLFGVVNFATFFEHTEPWMAAISTVEYGDPDDAGGAARAALADPQARPDQGAADGAARRQRHQRAGRRGRADRAGLKGRGVPVEYVLFPDEGHGWRKVPNRVRSITSMVEFFRKHLGRPAAAAVSAP